MTSISTKLLNESGLHARPAHLFVTTAQKYQSTIHVIKDDKKVDGKSILAILTLGASKNADIVIEAQGDDEKEAVTELGALIESNFGE
ncbi:HPr family phosphocarrier protein [Vallitalea pronyensis]|uniref:HPr family phosphocarrier protein n=1 Tax=Vallitalea pronyensis TaxID=1348613 RepID=A0A8J8SIG5_9FIRM|nr:HPr family phosphocarrier protein [Vallitalea pronyensis]QUI24566.1 HPr family phosphocarrier protein [Vallitalea pronyensis]